MLIFQSNEEVITTFIYDFHRVFLREITNYHKYWEENQTKQVHQLSCGFYMRGMLLEEMHNDCPEEFNNMGHRDSRSLSTLERWPLRGRSVMGEVVHSESFMSASVSLGPQSYHELVECGQVRSISCTSFTMLDTGVTWISR